MAMEHDQLQASLQRAPRNRVVWNASIVTPRGDQQVRVRDLSETGVRVWCEYEIPALADVIFKRGNVFAAAHVMWVKGQEAGLEFYRAIKIP